MPSNVQAKVTRGDSGGVHADNAVSKVEAELQRFSTFSHLEQITGVPKFYIFVGLCATFIGVCWIGLGAVLFGHLIALFYPAYRSFKAIAQLQAVMMEAGDDPQHVEKLRESVHRASKYLMYWVVYGCFNVVEYVCAVLLMIIPFYWPMKMLFLLWCVHPDTDGSVWVYERIVSPFLSKHEPLLDAHLGSLHAATAETYSEIQGDAAAIMRRNRSIIFEKVVHFLQRFSRAEAPPAEPVPVVTVKKEK